jgi:hypothetical protein
VTTPSGTTRFSAATISRRRATMLLSVSGNCTRDLYIRA